MANLSAYLEAMKKRPGGINAPTTGSDEAGRGRFGRVRVFEEMEQDRSLSHFSDTFKTPEEKDAFAATILMIASSRGKSQAKKLGEKDITAAISAATPTTREILSSHGINPDEANIKRFLSSARTAVEILYSVSFETRKSL